MVGRYSLIYYVSSRRYKIAKYELLSTIFHSHHSLCFLDRNRADPTYYIAIYSDLLFGALPLKS